MRAAPAKDVVSGTNYYRIYRNGSDNFDDYNISSFNETGGVFYADSGVSGTAGDGGAVRTDDANCYIALDAEL